MTHSISERRDSFRQLHQSGCFILPNPWDPGSARLLATMGFQALATTSTGFAWSIGKPDYAIILDDALEHFRALTEAVDLPVNADFESGFSATEEELAASVVMAAKTGIAGISIEDRMYGNMNKLYDRPTAVARIRAARDALKRANLPVILVARTEGLLVGGSPKEAIDKLVAFAEAGADCVYAPGIGMPGLSTLEDVKVLVRSVAPTPVNILVASPGTTFQQLADVGVRRISVGGALAQISWAAMLSAAQRLKNGSFEGLQGGTPGAQLNQTFSRYGSPQPGA
jgi:2-methylisocitrate lyase-like PEP mutase family enzyme